LRAKHRAFVNEYFRLNMNGTRAYLSVYGVDDSDVARAAAARLLANVSVAAEVERRLAAMQMSADEVLARLAEQARGEYAAYIGADGRINIPEMVRDGKAHLIKKIKTRTFIDGTDPEGMTQVDEVEFYDAHAALVDVGRAHSIFIDRKDITSGGEPIKYIEVVSDGSDDPEA
jgi:hypothetical protein